MGLGSNPNPQRGKEEEQLLAAAVHLRGWPASLPAAVPAAGGGSESEREGVSERERELDSRIRWRRRIGQ